MEPLKITWRLSQPVMLGDHPIHLDGLLAWVQVQRSIEACEEDPYSAQTNLPLERVGGVWKSSQVFFSPGPRFRETIVRKFEIQSMAREKGHVFEKGTDKPRAGSGKHKGFLMHKDGQLSTHAAAWCVGNRDLIQDILEDVGYLGRYSRLCFGEVHDFKIETPPTDESDYWKLRALPIDQKALCHDKFEYGKAMATLEAPYWDRVKSKESFVLLDSPTV